MKGDNLNRTFQEDIQNYTPSKAVFEASKCIECYDAPCVKGCPLHVDIPGFISLIKTKDYTGANQTVMDKCVLPGICARTCPVEELCVKNCCVTDLMDPVPINKLQRFVADYAFKNGMKEPPRQKPNGKKVAVIGSGPAGLSSAAELAKKGFNVVVFESENLPGGSLAYSIPAYRLPKDIVQAEIGYIEKMGVNFEVNTPIKDVRKLIKDGYDAVFIGTGLRDPVLLDVPGKELSGVISGLEFLRQVNKSSIENKSLIRFSGKKIAVVGGGDLAMDTAISAVKLGAKRVHLFYRRSFNEMPATPSSVQLAKDLGVMFWNLTNPKKIIGDAEGNVSKIECIETKLEGVDVSGRRKPVPIVGTEFQIDVNYVIAAIGQKPEELADYGIKTSSNRIILVNEKGETSDPAIFAGGDICSGGATVIQAMAEGVNAAKNIEEYLT